MPTTSDRLISLVVTFLLVEQSTQEATRWRMWRICMLVLTLPWSLN